MKSPISDFWDDKTREGTSISDVKEILKKEGFTILKDNDDKLFDIEVVKDNKTEFVEVKQDFTCFKTGNIGVEYECRGSSSGIMVSKATMYFYKIYEGENIRIFQVAKNKLKNSILQILAGLKEKEEKAAMAEKMGFTLKPKEEKAGRKSGFIISTIKSDKGDFELEYRLINGGDLGSNSLNIIIPKDIFLKLFNIKTFLIRPMTSQEKIDLDATLNKSAQRNKFK